MATLVCIHSFRGGTGKSNVTANLAATMGRRGERVAIVDSDIQSPGIHALFGLDAEDAGASLNDYLHFRCPIASAARDVTARLRLTGGGLDVVPGGACYLIPASMQPGEIAQVLRSGYDVALLERGYRDLAAALNLDRIFVDTHPGLNEETLLSMALADVLLVVMRPDRQDYQGTAVVADLAANLRVPHTFLVLNKVHEALDAGALRRQCERAYGIPVATMLPLAGDVARLASEDLFSLVQPQHPFSSGIRALAEVLATSDTPPGGAARGGTGAPGGAAVADPDALAEAPGERGPTPTSVRAREGEGVTLPPRATPAAADGGGVPENLGFAAPGRVALGAAPPANGTGRLPLVVAAASAELQRGVRLLAVHVPLLQLEVVWEPASGPELLEGYASWDPAPVLLDGALPGAGAAAAALLRAGVTEFIWVGPCAPVPLEGRTPAAVVGGADLPALGRAIATAAGRTLPLAAEGQCAQAERRRRAPPLGRCWVVHSPKGGGGCTLWTAGLAAALAASGWRVLAVDATAYGDLGQLIADTPPARSGAGLPALLAGRPSTEAGIRHLTSWGLDLLPGGADDAGGVADADGTRAATALASLRTTGHDVVLVDTDHTPTPWVRACLGVADRILVPLPTAPPARAQVQAWLERHGGALRPVPLDPNPVGAGAVGGAPTLAWNAAASVSPAELAWHPAIAAALKPLADELLSDTVAARDA